MFAHMTTKMNTLYTIKKEGTDKKRKMSDFVDFYDNVVYFILEEFHMAKAEYRSSLRSKMLIKEAAVELLSIKKWDKITVTDIVAKADINRGTFYAHYSNPVAVFKAIEADIVQKILSVVTAKPTLQVLRNPLPLLTQIQAYIESKPAAAKILLTSDISGQFVMHHKAELAEHFIKETKDVKVTDRERFEIAIRLLAYGTIDMYVSWVSGDIRAPLDEVTATMDLLIRNSMSQFLPPQNIQ